MVLLFLTSSLHDMLIYHEAGNWKRSKNLSKSTYLTVTYFHFSPFWGLFMIKYSRLDLKPPLLPKPSKPIYRTFWKSCECPWKFNSKRFHIWNHFLWEHKIFQKKKTHKKRPGWIHSKMQQNTRKSDTITTCTHISPV